MENSVEILLDLLQRYREKAGDKVAEKGGSIFTKACFLLAMLLQDRHRALVCTAHVRLKQHANLFQNISRTSPLVLGGHEPAQGFGEDSQHLPPHCS